MSQTVTVHLERPTTSVSILSDYDINAGTSVADGMGSGTTGDQSNLASDMSAQKNLHSDLCRTLEGLIAKLNGFYDEIFTGHKDEIAKLSVEIARKILIQKVQDGDYEIEAIVKETLKSFPSHDELVVRLNPADLEACQKIQQEGDGGALAGIKFVSDANIGRAECVLESPKGKVESLIDEHLEQIKKTLIKTE